MVQLEKIEENQLIKGSLMTNDETKKSAAPALPDDIENMSKQDAEAEFERFFKELESEVGELPDEVVEAGAQRMIDFIEGKISWAEVRNISKERIQKMVEAGYLQMESGRYEDAERIFKSLTILDWDNSYFHSLLGSVYQKQELYPEALYEYTEAIELNPQDYVSLANRAEVLLLTGFVKDAGKDCDAVINSGLDKENKWLKRALLIKLQIDNSGGKAKKPVESTKKTK